MGTATMNDSDDTIPLLRRGAAGDRLALGELWNRYRERLKRMVRLRLDRRLSGRVDPSDVLQEAFLDFARRAGEFAENPEVSFFLWLRTLTGQRLQMLHRQHLGAKMRDAAREISLHRGPMPQATSVSLAAQLLGHFTSASAKVARAEMQVQLQEALNGLDPIDREVLALRHFEELSNAETAEVLGIDLSAASSRHVRALRRLRQVLKSIPGLFDDNR
jgi:RNA polymerase sigma-70 factor (ECF subfamily)